VGLSLPETDVVRLVRLVRPAPVRAEVLARELVDESGAGCRSSSRRVPRRLAPGRRHAPRSWRALSRWKPTGSRPRFSAAGSAVHAAPFLEEHNRGLRPFIWTKTEDSDPR